MKRFYITVLHSILFYCAAGKVCRGYVVSAFVGKHADGGLGTSAVLTYDQSRGYCRGIGADLTTNINETCLREYILGLNYNMDVRFWTRPCQASTCRAVLATPTAFIPTSRDPANPLQAFLTVCEHGKWPLNAVFISGFHNHSISLSQYGQ